MTPSQLAIVAGKARGLYDKQAKERQMGELLAAAEKAK